MATAEERAALEKEIREQILTERRAAKKEWRRTHKDSIRRSNQKYRAKLKAKKERAEVGY
jgi:hypothetical protein